MGNGWMGRALHGLHHSRPLPGTAQRTWDENGHSQPSQGQDLQRGIAMKGHGYGGWFCLCNFSCCVLGSKRNLWHLALFSIKPMWVLGIGLRLSGLVTGASTHWAILQACHCLYSEVLWTRMAGHTIHPCLYNPEMPKRVISYFQRLSRNNILHFFLKMGFTNLLMTRWFYWQ